MLTERLRSAVTAGSYAEVDQLLVEYGASVDREWRAASEERRRDLAREASSLFDWAKHTILAARAHAQLRQAQLSRQSAYVKSAAAPSYVAIDA
jgi:hypothetical protein